MTAEPRNRADDITTVTDVPLYGCPVLLGIWLGVPLDFWWTTMFCGVRCELMRQLPMPSLTAITRARHLSPLPGLVWAFRIHSDGTPEMLPIDQPIPFSHDGLLWLHFNLADARALQWLTPPTSSSGAGARTAAVKGHLPAAPRHR